SSVLSPSVITSVSPVAMTTVLYFFATSFAMSGSFSSNTLSGLVVLSNTPPNTNISPALAQIADNSTVESMSSITFVLYVVAPTAIESNKTGTPASFAAFPASIIASVFSSLNVPKFKTSASAFAAISAASFGLLDIEGEAPMAINPFAEKLAAIIFFILYMRVDVFLIFVIYFIYSVYTFIYLFYFFSIIFLIVFDSIIHVISNNP